jgi:XTP/dITP diphosphohydrolase
VRYFEGRIDGAIAYEPRGTAGFGYDPVFVPNGYSQSFAQLGADQKNKISHRALAVNKLIQYLQK